MTNKDLKIRQMKLIMDSLTEALVSAIEHGADRDVENDEELPIFFMISRGAELLEGKLHDMQDKMTSKYKLDN